MSLVKLLEVSRTYGQGNVEVHAVEKISFSIPTAEFVAIAGPSGSGKTTLLNLIGGLDQPTQGQIWIEDFEITNMKASALSQIRLRKIGFVFQAYNLLPVLTAYENAEYVLLLQGVEEHKRREKVINLLERVGLKGMEHRFPRELSGGQQQRVAIARALAAEPALILADEPTANLDSKTGADLISLMAELNQEKKTTFVFSTHDRAVMEHAHRLILMKDGKISYDGSAEKAPSV